MEQRNEQGGDGNFLQSKPLDEVGKLIRGYRQRMVREWRERVVFESTEQRV